MRDEYPNNKLVSLLQSLFVHFINIHLNNLIWRTQAYTQAESQHYTEDYVGSYAAVYAKLLRILALRSRFPGS